MRWPWRRIEIDAQGRDRIGYRDADRVAFIVAPEVVLPPVPLTEPMGGMPAPEPTR